MKALLFPILLLAAMPAQAEDADRSDMSMFGGDKPVPGAFMMTGQFLDQCGDVDNAVACSSYLLGLIDGFEAIASLSKTPLWMCLPKGISGSAILDGFLNGVRPIGDDAGVRSLPTARFFHMYLRLHHACPKGDAK
jgi:hypothetical protein